MPQDRFQLKARISRMRQIEKRDSFMKSKRTLVLGADILLPELLP